MIGYSCRRCGSQNIRKNGHSKSGRQLMHCRDCCFHSTLAIRAAERAERRERLDALLVERMSQRAIGRVLHISRNTLRRFT